MNLKNKISLLKETRQGLKYKLLSEGLTKKENQILTDIESLIKEDEMTFGPEVGRARPSRTLQSKIEKGELPLSQFGLTQAQVDFFTSEAFKFSINRLEELIGSNSNIVRRLNISNPNFKTDAMTALRTLMGVVGELMNELTSLQIDNKEELEQIAIESVEKAMGIDNEFFTNMIKLDGELSYGFLPKLQGMKAKTDKISDEEILDKFADIDAEKNQKLEDLKNDFESMGVEFDEEKARQAIESTFEISPETLAKAKEEFSDAVKRRMIINYFRRGMALFYADAYKICMDKIEELPSGERILEISNVIQPIMLHMYWLFDDIGGIAQGGGQIGQVEVLSPEETGETSEPSDDYDDEGEDNEDFGGVFTVKARAMTLPLLVHELVKGVVMFFTSAAGSTDDEQRVLAKKTASSLEIEAYDLVFSEVFFRRFYEIFSEIVPNEDEQRELIPGVLKYFSEIEDEDPTNKGKLQKLVQSLTVGKDLDPYAESFVDEIIEKAREMTTNLKKDFPSYSKKKYDKEEEPTDDEDDLSWLDED